MNAYWKILWETLLKERHGSWMLLAIAFLVFGLLIRSFFLGPLIRRAKELPRPVLQEFKRNYLAHCLWGWIFFLVSFFMAVALWNTATEFPLTFEEALVMLGTLLSFILSIIFHMGALGIAALITLKQTSLSEKNF